MKNNNMAYLELMTKESYENKQFLDFYQNMLYNVNQTLCLKNVKCWLSSNYKYYRDSLDNSSYKC